MWILQSHNQFLAASALQTESLRLCRGSMRRSLLFLSIQNNKQQISSSHPTIGHAARNYLLCVNYMVDSVTTFGSTQQLLQERRLLCKVFNWNELTHFVFKFTIRLQSLRIVYKLRDSHLESSQRKCQSVTYKTRSQLIVFN